MADAVQEAKPPEPPPRPPELPRSTESATTSDTDRGARPESPTAAYHEAEAAARNEYTKARNDGSTGSDNDPRSITESPPADFPAHQADAPTIQESSPGTADSTTGPTADLADEMAERMDALRTEGHGPQRHHDPTDQQLQGRLGTPVRDGDGNVVLRPDGFVRSTDHIDPETGTTTGRDGSDHYCGPVSSRFDSAEDYVRAQAHLRQQAMDNQDNVADGSIHDILGEGAEARITGYYHDPANPGQFRAVDFTDGTILAVYDEGTDGGLSLRTMYAMPRPFIPDND